jgi:hypothetical protein
MFPQVPYGATAVRPKWADLPPSLREAISERLGGPVVAARSAGGGFTRAFAASLTTKNGFRAFIKAAPFRDPISQSYAQESSITTTLPVVVAAPRPRWTMTHSDYFVLCLDYVDGAVPSLPWNPAELESAVEAWNTAARALATPPFPGLPRLSDIVQSEMSVWTSGLLRDAHLNELVQLEQLLPHAVAGDGMLHGDLRIDNVLIDRDGKAWICDWTWPCLGAPWFDTLRLLVTAYASYASSAEVDRFLADAPAEGIDAALAGLAGYWLGRAAGPPSSASPHSRQHQTYSGRAALAWLADRRGWS